MFFLSIRKNVVVAAMGSWDQGLWSWGDFGLPHQMENNNVLLLQDLFFVLNYFFPIVQMREVFTWVPDPEGLSQ